MRDTEDPAHVLPELKRFDNDYLIVCAGNRYVSHVNAFANGTHVVTIKVAPREEGGS